MIAQKQNNMTEYDQLCNILSNEFLSDSQDVMIEEKGTTHKAQRVNIDDGKRKLVWNLYRFDLDEKDFLHCGNALGCMFGCGYSLHGHHSQVG